MITNIKFKEACEFQVSRKNHLGFPTRHVIPNKWDRAKEPYDMFILFKKGFSIKPRPVTIIVGDNGCGKSTLLDCIKGYIGKPPDSTYPNFSFTDDKLTDEEREENDMKERREQSSIIIKSDKIITYNNTVIFNAERDNPAVAIPKLLNPDSKDFSMMVNTLFNSHEDSHGESLIPILNLLLTNISNSVICIDEPETALSLKNQIRIGKLIKESVEKRNTQLIVCTHSLCIIQMFEDIYDMNTRVWVKSKDYIESMIK